MTLAKLQKSFYKHLRESFAIHKILIFVLLLGLSSEIYASDSPKITLTAKTNPKSQKVIRKGLKPQSNLYPKPQILNQADSSVSK